MGIAGLGCLNLFVFVDESAPTFQWVVTDLPIEGQLYSHCAFSLREKRHCAFEGSVDGKALTPFGLHLRTWAITAPNYGR
jgi:hypothetical protein